MSLTAGGTAALATIGSDLRAIDFSVYKGSGQIGRHAIDFTSLADGGTQVDIAIDLEVRFLGITLYEYSHRNVEIWRDGRLVSMETRTDNDGEILTVSAVPTSDGLRVTGRDGTVIASADILPTSYWHPDTVTQTQLLNTQTGNIEDVTVKTLGRETVTLDGAGAPATRYKLNGNLNLDIWYCGANVDEWCKMTFMVMGSEISYQPRRVELPDFLAQSRDS